ncbi:MAG: hypothetical protein AAF488_03615 [Planctomycetota bacterium]
MFSRFNLTIRLVALLAVAGCAMTTAPQGPTVARAYALFQT